MSYLELFFETRILQMLGKLEEIFLADVLNLNEHKQLV